MTRKRLISLSTLAATFAIIAFGGRHYGYWDRIRSRFPGPENTGDYAGALTRVIPPYDSSKSPSRPWLDPHRAAPPLTTFHAYTASAINGGQTDCLLYLPPGYDAPVNASRHYPVIYWLHGYQAEPKDGIPFVETLDAAIRAGIMPPVIAVLPNGLQDSWYVDSTDASQPVESVIIKDLIPHIDSTLRTIADRRARAIEGFSMGGWGAAHLAFKYPNLFCAVTLVSAPLHTHVTFPQFGRIFDRSEADFYAEDPVTRIKRDAVQLKDALRIRILAGEKDWTVRFARAFDRRLGEWGILHEMTIVPGASHNDDDIYQGLGPAAFTFYKEIFTPTRPGMSRDIHPRTMMH